MTFVKKYALTAIVLVIGIGLGWIFFSGSGQSAKQKNVLDTCPYSLINPLRCGDNVPEQTEYTVFKKKLLDELVKDKKSGLVSEAALYFRDLNNGPTFYYNEQLEFAPMSLLKLPVMLAVYKYVENNPKLLEEKLRTPASFAQNIQVLPDAETLQPNTEYTLDEIVRYMIVYSDNRSVDMLTAWLNERGSNYEMIRRTMSDLGITGYEADLSNTKITVKQYASIFRILYNASYLSPEMSNKALGILGQSIFKDGLESDLPDDVMVAHKFGIRLYGDTEQQLHDCGIVYHQKAPYMICIMTRGKKSEDLSKYIKRTSRQVFDEVERRSN